MADKVSGPPGGGAVFLGHVSRPPVQGAQLAGREVSVVSEGSPFTKISTSVKAIKEAATGIIARVAGATTSPVFLARVDDLGELLQGVDISKMPTELRKELLGLMSITRKAFEALGIPHVKLSENIAKLEQMTQGFLAVQEFNEAVKDLGSGKKLTFDTQQKLVVTKRKPFAWVKQLLGKVGTSTRSDAAGIALITKLDRAHENGKNLTEAECEECYKSILALEQNGWFKGCLGHTGALYRERFEKAKEYFYFRVHGQRAADNLEAAFNEKIHSLEDKIKGLEAKISVLKQGQQDKERKKELGGLTIALKTASDELKAMRPSKEKMMWYLRENAASMIKRAEQSRVGGVTASKSETGLPYSLRCFKDKESGNFFFEISFGSFAHGGEANIKELVDLETGEKKVKKTLLRSEGVGEAEVRQKKIEKETGFVQKLVRAKVPGVVEVEWETYEGKGGVEKKRPTSKKYEGGTLRDYTESTAGGDPAVNLQKNKSIATQVVRTVYHMHQQGVVHHDLKEDNVLLDTKGTTGLIDFGAAGKTGPQHRGPATTRVVNRQSQAYLVYQYRDRRCTRWRHNDELFR